MFSGQAAIDYLAAKAVKDDPNASSHWQKYLSEFKFTGREFAGLRVLEEGKSSPRDCVYGFCSSFSGASGTLVVGMPNSVRLMSLPVK